MQQTRFQTAIVGSRHERLHVMLPASLLETVILLSVQTILLSDRHVSLVDTLANLLMAFANDFTSCFESTCVSPVIG